MFPSFVRRSPVPTFRDPGGLWRQHDPLSLATPEAFRRDPSKVWQFYHYRRQVCLSAQPNGAHRTLSWLGSPEAKKQVWAAAQSDFRLITQNVDGLSKRSNDSLTRSQDRNSGGKGNEMQLADPMEMHGSLFRTRCTSCGTTRDNFDSPICQGLAGSEDISKPLTDLPLTQLPRCSKDDGGCGGLLRPAVVWFGESIPLLDKIYPRVEQCDLLLVLGTSSTVYPAAGFASQVQAQGGKVAVFNLQQDGSDDADYFFEGKVEVTLPEALGLRPGATDDA